MKVENIDYIACATEDCVVKKNHLTGAASAFAGGDTFAGYGSAGADGYGAAQGRQAKTAIDTGVKTNIGYGFSFSQASARVKAAALDANAAASANYLGRSTFTGFKGSASSRKLAQHISYSTSSH